MNKFKRELLHCDIISIVVLILLIALRVLSVYFLHTTAELSQTNVESIIKVMEANPVTNLILMLGNIGYIIQFVVIPAAYCTVYLYFRKKTINKKFSIDVLSLFTNFGFFALVMNIINDVTVLLGLVH